MNSTKERLRELALDIAAANGVKRVEIYRGRSYEQAERDYQSAVEAFDKALNEVLDS